MYREIWKKFRRVLAIVLIAALCGSNVPQMLFEVQAETTDTLVTITEEMVTYADDTIVKDGQANYTGSAIEPAVKVTYDGNELVQDTDYTVIYEDNTEVSADENTAKIIVTGTAAENAESGYTGSVTLTFSIVEDTNENKVFTVDDVMFTSPYATVEPEDAEAYPIYSYTKNAIEIVDTVTYTDEDGNTNTLVKDTDYTVTYTNNVEASAGADAVVTISGIGEYSSTTPIEKTFGIRKVLNADNTEVVITDTENIVYDGNAKEPEMTVTYILEEAEDTLNIGDDYAVEFADNVNAGTDTAKATIKGTGAYYGNVETGFSIQPMNISGKSISIEPVSVSYSGNAIVLEDLEVKADGSVLEAEYYTLSYLVDGVATEVKEVDVYKLTLEGKNNYTGKVENIEFKVLGEITSECVEITNSYINENGTIYCKNVSDVTITGINDEIVYTITGCTGNAVLDEITGCVTLNGDGVITLTVKGEKNNEVLCQGNVELTFVLDEAAPDLEVIQNNEGEYPAENPIWAKEMNEPTVNCTDTGADLKAIYYIENSDGKTDEELLALEFTEDQKWVSGVLEQEKTYCFIAEDNVGNRSIYTVTTPKLDIKPPVITVKDGESTIENADTIYLNKNNLTDGAKTFDVTASDEEGSGVNNAFAPVTQYTPAAEEETKVITNQATDNVGNDPAIHEFTIIYDDVLPSISAVEVAPNDTDDKAVILENAPEITTKQDVKIMATVTDTNLEKVELVNVNDVDNPVEMTYDNETGKYICVITKPANSVFDGTYQIKAYDKAGNEVVYEKQIVVHIDTKAPVVKNIMLDQVANADKWRNEDTTFTITVEDENSSEKDIKLQWFKVSDTENKNAAVSSTEWTTLEPGENSIIEGETTTYTFTFMETDENFSGHYYFRAIDDLGNGEELTLEELKNDFSNQVTEFKKDRKAPDVSKIYIAYGEQKISGSQEFIDGFCEHIFGKNTLTAYLYIRLDDISGIASVNYIHNGKSDTAKVLEGVSGTIKENINGEEVEVSYSVIQIDLKQQTEKSIEDFNLHITSIIDKAGNEGLVSEQPTKITGDDVLIIDNVAPELTVEYGGKYENHTYNDTPYYVLENTQDKEYEEIVLTYSEAFYEYNLGEADESGNRQPKKPEIVIESFDNNLKPTIIWGTFENNQISATIQLPYSKSESGEEISYTITTSYADGSGNQLAVGDKLFGTVDKDTHQYVSNTIVLDNKTPEIYGYSIETKEQGTYGANASVSGNDLLNVYQSKTVTAKFEIDDNVAFWNQDSVCVTISRNGSEYGKVYGNDSKIKWSDEGNIHTATYTFTDKADEPASATYSMKVSYIDLAKNVEEYSAKEFVLDTSTPKFGISFNNADKLVPVNGEGEILKDEAPTTGYIAYYSNDKKRDKGIEVQVRITEPYAQQKWSEAGVLVGLQDLSLNVRKEDAEGNFKTYTNYTVTWQQDAQNSNIYIGSFILAEEGTYDIRANYKDIAGNKMVASTTDPVQGHFENIKGGTAFSKDGESGYQSINLVLDNSAPKLTAKFITKSGKNDINTVYTITKKGCDTRKYYNNENLYLRVKVEDSNVDSNDLKDILDNMTLTDSKGDKISNDEVFKNWKPVELSNGKGFYVDLPLKDANYSIPIKCTDISGNTTNIGKQLVTVDREAPTVVFEYKATTQSVKDKVIDVVRYADIGYLFADTKLTVTATVTTEGKNIGEKVSGVQEIAFDIVGAEEKFERKKAFDSAADIKAKNDKKGKETKAPTYTYEVSVPMKKSDFKGDINVTVTDWCGNEYSEIHGYVVESAAMHAATSSALININTAPSRTVDGIAYYNTSVDLGFEFKDEYAGIREWEYSTEKESKSVNYQKNADDKYNENKTYGEGDDFKIKTEHKEPHTLNGNEYNYNGVRITARFVDNAGHESSVEKKLNIDVTKPIINVSYDLNDPANERYYNAARTATVVIQERNFDERDVEFTITNTDGVMPSISGWSSSGSGDDTYHTCYVTFAEDGDYTFTVAFQDLAGNVADYDIVDEFTIDRTIPTYTVTYDNNESKNGYYYAAERTATIDIVEHNFDASLVNIAMTATKGEGGVPAVSGWSRSGDHNIATIYFSEDADYTFDISGLDMAENPLDDYEMDHFVIDTKAPELTIANVEDMFAYNGIVMPEIRYSDINYDAENSIIDMQGYKNGKIEMQGDITRSDTGAEIKLHDIEHVQELDDIYTMNATVFDLAGNSSEASIRFSVNRFGSVYTFDDEKTEELIGENGKYYTKEEQDLVITETNVDTLEFMEITCNLNGKLYTLEEGVHYTLEESGSDMSWKQYTYTISKDNFVEEGTYLLTIYSKDRATNTSDNGSKGKKIEFVVDKTNPSVLISGIENGEQYRESSREVTLDIQDNVRLSEVKVKLNGQESVYTAAQLEELNGKVILNIGRNNDWQTLQVTAFDAAGNSVSSEELQFLVTTNILIHLIRNTPLLILVGAIVIVIGAGGFYIFGYKKRKKGTQSK